MFVTGKFRISLERNNEIRKEIRYSSCVILMRHKTDYNMIFVSPIDVKSFFFFFRFLDEKYKENIHHLCFSTYWEDIGDIKKNSHVNSYGTVKKLTHCLIRHLWLWCFVWDLLTQMTEHIGSFTWQCAERRPARGQIVRPDGNLRVVEGWSVWENAAKSGHSV